jgi:hypothetical protein
MNERSRSNETVSDILKTEAVVLAFAAAAFLLLGLLV